MKKRQGREKLQPGQFTCRTQVVLALLGPPDLGRGKTHTVVVMDFEVKQATCS